VLFFSCPHCGADKFDPDVRHEDVCPGGLVLDMWVIYEHPKDHPEHYVLRRWRLYRGQPDATPDPEFLLCPTLELARAAVPPGTFNLGRSLEQDPVIKEVWV
jgi:hypothetical protein